jgi:anti-sigma regulatory factor (Ser/Thr protein kinase)
MRLLLEQAVSDESAQILVRSRLRAVSRRMGVAELTRERLELICNEMMSNQVKYARGTGFMQLWEVDVPRPAIDVFALDYGPGVANLPSAVADGFTTSGTMGKGLGAISRMAHESEFYTIPAGVAKDSPWHGTALWARIYLDKGTGADLHQFGVLTRAYHDDPYNGDHVEVRVARQRARWLHMDGLGHGQEAAEAVACARDVLDMDMGLEEILEHVARRMHGGRGAVAVVAELNVATDSASLCGVGDAAAYVIRNGERRVVTFAPGVLGHAHGSLEPVVETAERHALVLTASDGLRRNWTLGTFPGLWRLHPQLIALLLGYVLGRNNDDKSIFVVRKAPDTREN